MNILRSRVFFYASLYLFSIGALAVCPKASKSTDLGVRYTSSSNRLYVQHGAVCTIEEISAHWGSHLTRTENGSEDIFYLKAKLVVEDGSRLNIYGAPFGEVGELRLHSNNGDNQNQVISIHTDWGFLDINSTKIISWDVTSSPAGPHKNLNTNSQPRAYIRTNSSLEKITNSSTNNDVLYQQHESTMNIKNSEISYLGYQGGQAYGLTWKVNEPIGTYAAIDVYGDVIGNYIHHNHFGIYTYGAHGMKITDNEVSYNKVYGIDPHDDSDNLVIQRNYVHNNGKHGIICSKRCDSLDISYNDSVNNADHGIMLHREVDNSTVECNYVADNGSTGIALFESNYNQIKNNRVQKNKYGIRLSVGASYNLIENNVIEDSAKDDLNKGGYGVYFYSGSDKGVRCDSRVYFDPNQANNSFDSCTRRPTYNRFINNLIDGSESHPIKINDSDRNLFMNNTIIGDSSSSNATKVHITNALNTSFVNNIMSNIKFSVRGGETTSWPYTASRSTLILSGNSPDQYNVSLSDEFSSVQRIANNKVIENNPVVINCPDNRHPNSPVSGSELD